MRVLLTGASGLLGSYILRQLGTEDVTAWHGSRSVDLCNPDAVAVAFREARPDVVIHAAALARVDECRRQPEIARTINTRGTALLAELAAERDARLVHVSTDLVFDGEHAPYREDDLLAPLSVYGRTKADAETAVLAVPRTVVVRVSLLFGPSLTGRRGFFDEQVAALREGRPLTLFTDEWRTPLSLHTAARALVAVARSDIMGRLHLGGPERLSRLEMGQQLGAFLGVRDPNIVATTRDAVRTAEPRPRDVSLDSSRWRSLFADQPWPTFQEALQEMLPA